MFTYLNQEKYCLLPRLRSVLPVRAVTLHFRWTKRDVSYPSTAAITSLLATTMLYLHYSQSVVSWLKSFKLQWQNNGKWDLAEKFSAPTYINRRRYKYTCMNMHTQIDAHAWIYMYIYRIQSISHLEYLVNPLVALMLIGSQSKGILLHLKKQTFFCRFQAGVMINDVPENMEH